MVRPATKAGSVLSGRNSEGCFLPCIRALMHSFSALFFVRRPVSVRPPGRIGCGAMGGWLLQPGHTGIIVLLSIFQGQGILLSVSTQPVQPACFRLCWWLPARVEKAAALAWHLVLDCGFADVAEWTSSGCIGCWVRSHGRHDASAWHGLYHSK